MCVLKGFHCSLVAKVPRHQTFPEWSKTEFFFQPPLNSKLFSFIFFFNPPLLVPVLGSCECKDSSVVLLPGAQKKQSCAIAALSYVLQLISVRRNKIRKKTKNAYSKYTFFFFFKDQKLILLPWTGVRKT